MIRGLIAVGILILGVVGYNISFSNNVDRNVPGATTGAGKSSLAE
jgi:preprotein translocase subunit Sss1